jgi:hypothetical protein
MSNIKHNFYDADIEWAHFDGRVVELSFSSEVPYVELSYSDILELADAIKKIGLED